MPNLVVKTYDYVNKKANDNLLCSWAYWKEKLLNLPYEKEIRKISNENDLVIVKANNSETSQIDFYLREVEKTVDRQNADNIDEKRIVFYVKNGESKEKFKEKIESFFKENKIDFTNVNLIDDFPDPEHTFAVVHCKEKYNYEIVDLTNYEKSEEDSINEKSKINKTVAVTLRQIKRLMQIVNYGKEK